MDERPVLWYQSKRDSKWRYPLRLVWWSIEHAEGGDLLKVEPQFGESVRFLVEGEQFGVDLPELWRGQGQQWATFVGNELTSDERHLYVFRVLR